MGGSKLGGNGGAGTGVAVAPAPCVCDNLDTVEMVAENTFYRLIDGKLQPITVRLDSIEDRIETNISFRERLIGSRGTLAAIGTGIMVVIEIIRFLRGVK